MRRAYIPRVTGFSGPMMGIERIAAGIREAVKQDPRRATHGDTKYNAFFILPDGGILSWDQYGQLPRSAPGQPAADTAAVHSHSAENWKWYEQTSGQKEPFSPLNAGDVKAFQQLVNAGAANTMALIMADGRLEVLHAPYTAQSGRFRAATKRMITNRVEGTARRRAEAWQAAKAPEEVDRAFLRPFAASHGLRYLENLRWKPEEEPSLITRKAKPARPRTVYKGKPARRTAAFRYYTSPYYNLLPPELWPIVPTQPELFKTSPRIKRKGTYTHLYPPEPVQMRFFGAGGFAGRIMSCGIWLENERGGWYCGKYGPSCDGQKACQKAPAGRLKVCADFKQVWSDFYGKLIHRCGRYAPACTPRACLPEPMPMPARRFKPPTEREIRDLAQALAQEYNFMQAEAGPVLAREILSRGGIAPYKGGELREEYRRLPLHLKNRRGLPLDEMAAEMMMDEHELIAAIQHAYAQKVERRRSWRYYEDAAYAMLLEEKERGAGLEGTKRRR